MSSLPGTILASLTLMMPQSSLTSPFANQSPPTDRNDRIIGIVNNEKGFIKLDDWIYNYFFTAAIRRRIICQSLIELQSV